MEIIVMDKPRMQLKKDLRQRVKVLKPLLPIDWRERLVQKYPEYDRLHLFTFVNNVFRGYSTDDRLTIILEEIAEEYQKTLTQPDTPTEAA